MNLAESEKAIREAIQSHLAKGGTLARGSFGYGRTTCKCPMNLLVGDNSGNTVELAAEKLGWSAEEVWDFIFGFDGVENNMWPQCEMGHRFASEFKEHIT